MLAGQLTPLMHVPEGPASVKHTPTGAPLDAHAQLRLGEAPPQPGAPGSGRWVRGERRRQSLVLQRSLVPLCAAKQ